MLLLTDRPRPVDSTPGASVAIDVDSSHSAPNRSGQFSTWTNISREETIRRLRRRRDGGKLARLTNQPPPRGRLVEVAGAIIYRRLSNGKAEVGGEAERAARARSIPRNFRDSVTAAATAGILRRPRPEWNRRT